MELTEEKQRVLTYVNRLIDKKKDELLKECFKNNIEYQKFD